MKFVFYIYLLFELLIYCDWGNLVYLWGIFKNSFVEVIEYLVVFVVDIGIVDTVILTVILCGVEMEGDLLILDVKGYFIYYFVFFVKLIVVMIDVFIIWLMV